MPETSGMPERRDVWSNPFVLDAIRARGYDDYGLLGGESSDEQPDDAEPVAPVVAGQRRSRRTAEKIRAVIAEATGQEPEDLDLDPTDMDAVGAVIENDLTDPQSAWQALDATLSNQRLTQGHSDPDEPAATAEEVREAQRIVVQAMRLTSRVKAGESDGAWRVRDGNWREQNGLPRKKKKPSPNRSPERRRLERMRAKARQLGISVEEADAMTPRDPRVSSMSSPTQETSNADHQPTPDR